MKRNKVKPDPYGSDAEFDAYMRASNRKLYLIIAALVVLSVLFVSI
jgi:hypothetical protein